MATEAHLVCRELGRSDFDAAADVMVDAFLDDPGTAFLFPTERLRRKWGTRSLRFGTEATLHPGAALGAFSEAGTLVGVALWVPPGARSPLSWFRRLVLGLRIMPLVFEARSWVRSNRYMVASQRARPRNLGPAWTLAGLAVASTYRGQGVGRLLLRRGLERAGGCTAPRPVVVDTWAHRLAFYQTHGFRSIAEQRIDDEMAPLHTLIWVPEEGRESFFAGLDRSVPLVYREIPDWILGGASALWLVATLGATALCWRIGLRSDSQELELIPPGMAAISAGFGVTYLRVARHSHGILRILARAAVLLGVMIVAAPLIVAVGIVLLRGSN